MYFLLIGFNLYFFVILPLFSYKYDTFVTDLLPDLFFVTNKNYMKSSVTVRYKKLSSGRQSAYLDIYLNGVRQYEFLQMYLDPEDGTKATTRKNKETYDAVQAIAAIRTSQILQGHYTTTSNQYSSLSILDLISNASERDVYRTVARKLSPLLLDKHVKDINIRLINDVRTYIMALPLSQNSKEVYFTTFLNCIRLAISNEMMDPIDLDNIVKIKREETTRQFLSPEEIKSFWTIDASKFRDVKESFVFSCMTGLRISDILSLSWDHIDINSRLISVRMQKTKKYVYVPINDLAFNILQTQKSKTIPDNKVFNLYNNVFSINSSLLRIAQLAGIRKKVTFHVARHTFATLSISRDVDIYTVSKLLGHTNVKTTAIYAKVLDESKRKATDKINIDLDM